MYLHRQEIKALAMLDSGSLFVLGAQSFHFPSGVFSHPLDVMSPGRKKGGGEREPYFGISWGADCDIRGGEESPGLGQHSTHVVWGARDKYLAFAGAAFRGALLACSGRSRLMTHSLQSAPD
ncbi:hypothetical protein TNCT_523891 [Trichonephila clavata]|uniref:Uncharacterized protein n=1 Tax=Trichonephila clavata TaxID=2740835 RepID=A0A8X6GSW8_TRICU|nr:hypothetical protein TNCT_523891 [Trichonephila clavata]